MQALDVEIRVSGLAVSRGERQLFTGVSLAFVPGRALLLTGPNGAGKSTLIRALLGLVRRDAGTISVGDDPERELAPLCHYLGHRDGLKAALSVRENLTFWADFLGERSDIDAALKAVELSNLADLPAGVLSAGQRRRLAIARLIAVPRPVWLLDEPTAALDRASETRLTELMRRHLGAGGSLLAATHLPLDLPDAERLDISAFRPVELMA